MGLLVKKSAVGCKTFTKLTPIIVSEHPDALYAMSVTLNIHVEVYVCEGLCAVDESPSPKYHIHEIEFTDILLK